MNNINLDEILNRNIIKNDILNFLNNFEENKYNIKSKRCIYLYGPSGSGKTYFIKNLLKENNYDIIYYNSNNIRNKKSIKNLNNNNLSNATILNLLKGNIKKKIILMDEIDSMNNGDKGGINTLIKLIRPKKTIKQKKEFLTFIPIIAIGNNKVDKKIKELKKNCICLKFDLPNTDQMIHILKTLMPKINHKKLIKYTQYNLKKIDLLYNLYKTDYKLLKNYLKLFKLKNYYKSTKNITKDILSKKYSIVNHKKIINETDRTSIGLLFHENIVDLFKDFKGNINIYIEILSNINYCDYIDRITFQKQIWIFNEMSSLIKLIYNNNTLFSHLNQIKKLNETDEIRFTKVLTKYSTEYNNNIFIQKLCKELNMDKKDLIIFFFILLKKYTKEEIDKKFKIENYNIDKLDIIRIYKYLDNIY